VCLQARPLDLLAARYLFMYKKHAAMHVDDGTPTGIDIKEPYK